MAKFVIECPSCGKYAEAKSGFFAKKRIDCACGNKGITMKFCGQCGARKPEPQPATWDCKCGQKAIETGFCPNCGSKKE